MVRNTVPVSAVHACWRCLDGSPYTSLPFSSSLYR